MAGVGWCRENKGLGVAIAEIPVPAGKETAVGGTQVGEGDSLSLAVVGGGGEMCSRRRRDNQWQ